VQVAKRIAFPLKTPFGISEGTFAIVARPSSDEQESPDVKESGKKSGKRMGEREYSVQNRQLLKAYSNERAALRTSAEKASASTATDTGSDNVTKTFSAGTGGSYYIYSFDGKLMAEYNIMGQWVRDYIYAGNRLIAEYRGSGIYHYYTSDQVNSTRIVTTNAGDFEYSEAYDPYGGVQKTWSLYYEPTLKFSGKERDQESGLDYFGARYFYTAHYRWLSVDPVINQDEAQANPQLWNLYAFCRNNPINYSDQNGRKDLPFNPAKDVAVDWAKVKSEQTPLLIDGLPNPRAFNCHSFAWHDSQGDPTDPGNAKLVKLGITKWNESPADDIFSQGYSRLDPDAPNKPGDRVIYYTDLNKNGKYDSGEPISHSAIVYAVDEQGNTILVQGKMGQLGISINHPNAPGYYEKDRSGKQTSREYFRK
jgi:RHS repeat-associated protein